MNFDLYKCFSISALNIFVLNKLVRCFFLFAEILTEISSKKQNIKNASAASNIPAAVLYIYIILRSKTSLKLDRIDLQSTVNNSYFNMVFTIFQTVFVIRSLPCSALAGNIFVNRLAVNFNIYNS